MSYEGCYETHCYRENTRYLLAYEEWEAALSPEERAKLGRAAAPELEDHRAHSSKRMVLGALGDVAERSSASYSVDYAAALDGGASILAERSGISITQAEAVFAFMQERVERESAERESRAIVSIAAAFLKGANSKLLAAGLAFASDLALTNGLGTMQDWARENGVSRAAVSKVAKFWQRQLGLPAGSHMRDEKKCRAYSEAQKTKHWRNKKVSSPALEGAEMQIVEKKQL
jgi:hypothetical protein